MNGPLRKDHILYTGEAFSPVKKRRFFSKRPVIWALSVVLLVTIAVGAFWVMRRDEFRISKVNINGLVALDEGEMRNVIFGEISGNMFFLIPRNNFAIVSSKTLESILKRKFPKIENIDVKKSSASVIDVVVSERVIWGIGCVRTEIEEIKEEADDKKTETTNTVGPCFYIDRGGFAFEDVFSFEGGLFPVLYKSGPGGIGLQLFERSDADFFEEADKALSGSLQLPLLSADFPASGEDVRLTLKEGWSLIVTRSKAPSTWVSVLRTLLNGEIKEKRERLDYADLRFGNKVFYKFR